MPKLILMRHGEAHLSATFSALSDEQRSLTEAGQQQVRVQSANADIAWQCLHQVWVSPFLRTQQTYHLLQKSLPEKTTHLWQLETNALISPNGNPAKVQECLLTSPIADTLLITHQPLISQLIGFFAHGHSSAGESMYEASVAVLEGGMFASGCMELKVLSHA